MAVSWEHKLRWRTGYSADSVEWCPVEPHHDVLVCATYQLEKPDNPGNDAKQTRLGRIYLFSVTKHTTELRPIQVVETAGVLDQKWCYHTIGGYPILAVTTSEGSLLLYRLVAENGTLDLKLWLDHVIGQDILALSLDWSTNKTHSDEPCLVVSDSTGSVKVLKLVGNALETVGVWKSHEYEAWIAAFNYWDPNVLYSGGDDCIFKRYDTRTADRATAVNRSHEAGVTAIRSHLEVEHQLLTGSYDENIRVWDTRNHKSPLNQINVAGGVWRLKWHPHTTNTVLAACMYGGCRVLRAAGQLEVLAKYVAHESIAYGVDWQFGCEQPLVATCSFYDCQLHISEVSLSM